MSNVSNSNSPDPDSNSAPMNQFRTVARERMDGERGDAAERSLWQGRYSPKAMFGTWALMAVLTIAALVLVAMFGQSIAYVWQIVGTLILLGWCIAIGTYLYRRLGMHYELTTQRFIHQTGILSRKTDRIEVIDIDDVSYTQGVVQRMLGVGSITLTGSDRTHPELVLMGIDRVPEIASLIDDIRRDERRRRSLHIESI